MKNYSAEKVGVRLGEVEMIDNLDQIEHELDIAGVSKKGFNGRTIPIKDRIISAIRMLAEAKRDLKAIENDTGIIVIHNKAGQPLGCFANEEILNNFIGMNKEVYDEKT